jgi:hypothetical protein
LPAISACAVIAAVAGYQRLRADRSEPSVEPEAERDEDWEDELAEEEPAGYQPADDQPEEPLESYSSTWKSPQSQSLHHAIQGAAAGLAIAGRNWRGAGYRLVGLRRVDARTGGTVTTRSALIGVLYDQAWQAAWSPLITSRIQRRQDRLRALAPQLSAVQRAHGTDPQARQKAVMEFYKTHDVNPASGCGWMLAGPLTSQLVVALCSRGGRTLRDRITGTAVVVDR